MGWWSYAKRQTFGPKALGMTWALLGASRSALGGLLRRLGLTWASQAFFHGFRELWQRFQHSQIKFLLRCVPSPAHPEKMSRGVALIREV